MAVYTSTLTVTGLSSDRYRIQNPIYVDVKDIPSSIRYVRVTITALAINVGDPTPDPFSLRMRPYDEALYFDLARYMRGMMPSPKHPEQLTNGMLITRNTMRARIKITSIDQDDQVSDTRTFTKTFVRSGIWTRDTNVSVEAGTVLKLSSKIPQWPGYPIAKYTLTSGSTIQFNSILQTSEVDQRRVVGCDPVYFRFLNRDGGYSFWLFESFTMKKKTSKTKVIDRRGVMRTTGNEAEYTLEVRGRVEREYFNTMESLAEAPEVAVYALENIVNKTQSVSIKERWTDVINPGQSVNIPGEAEYLDMSFSFDVRLTHNPQVRW